MTKHSKWLITLLLTEACFCTVATAGFAYLLFAGEIPAQWPTLLVFLVALVYSALYWVSLWGIVSKRKPDTDSSKCSVCHMTDALYRQPSDLPTGLNLKGTPYLTLPLCAKCFDACLLTTTGPTTSTGGILTSSSTIEDSDLIPNLLKPQCQSSPPPNSRVTPLYRKLQEAKLEQLRNEESYLSSLTESTPPSLPILRRPPSENTSIRMTLNRDFASCSKHDLMQLKLAAQNIVKAANSKAQVIVYDTRTNIVALAERVEIVIKGSNRAT